MKTQLDIAYLWGLNYKPFGTGSFATQKKHVMNVFLGRHTPESPVFVKYIERIAELASWEERLGRPRMPTATPQDRQDVFIRIPELCPPFVKALDLRSWGVGSLGTTAPSRSSANTGWPRCFWKTRTVMSRIQILTALLSRKFEMWAEQEVQLRN